jgi:hypothetical protein
MESVVDRTAASHAIRALALAHRKAKEPDDIVREELFLDARPIRVPRGPLSAQQKLVRALSALAGILLLLIAMLTLWIVKLPNEQDATRASASLSDRTVGPQSAAHLQVTGGPQIALDEQPPPLEPSAIAIAAPAEDVALEELAPEALAPEELAPEALPSIPSAPLGPANLSSTALVESSAAPLARTSPTPPVESSTQPEPVPAKRVAALQPAPEAPPPAPAVKAPPAPAQLTTARARALPQPARTRRTRQLAMKTPEVKRSEVPAASALAPSPEIVPSTAPPAPASAMAPAAKLSANPAGCDEVACLVEPKACCTKNRPKTLQKQEIALPQTRRAMTAETRALPKRLSSSDLREGIRSIQGRLSICSNRHQVRGVVRAKLTISPQGAVQHVSLRTGSVEFQQCIGKVLRLTRFSPTAEATTVSFPIVLR